jgi:hypothetical protein
LVTDFCDCEYFIMIFFLWNGQNYDYNGGFSTGKMALSPCKHWPIERLAHGPGWMRKKWMGQAVKLVSSKMAGGGDCSLKPTVTVF